VTSSRAIRATVAALAALVLASCITQATPSPSPSATTSASATASTRPRLELSTYQYALQTKGKMRVGVRDTSAPYASRAASGRYEGLEPDLAREIAKAIWGTKDDPDSHIEWISIDMSTRVAALTSNQADIVLAALPIDDSTSKVVDLTDPYYKDGQRLLVKKTNEDIKELVDAASGEETVSAVKGSPWEANIRRITNDRAKVLPLDSVEFCIQALASGAADAFTQDEAALVAIATKDPTLKVVAKQFTDDRLGIGIKKNESADRQGFKEFVNTALLKIVADRTWAAIFEKYVTPVTGEKKQLPTD
jgi:putative glutamine transport system substrate-binding protein